MSARLTTLLKKQFTIFGIPRTIVSDGGLQFETFAKQWGITHIMSRPGHQSANGKAESAMKIIKNMMIKTMKDGQDQYEALLELRNTPRQYSNQSPAEMMFWQNTRTVCPKSINRNLLIVKNAFRENKLSESHMTKDPITYTNLRKDRQFSMNIRRAKCD